MSKTAQGFEVVQPGILSLLQDAGRFGQHNIGLTTGGPLDKLSFDWANRLCNNEAGSCALEVSVGGLSMIAHVDTQIAIAGGDSQLSINKTPKRGWRSYAVKAGDKIEVGFAKGATRSYLAVAGGFQVEPMFGSVATVAREKLGGLNGGGIKAGDILPCQPKTGAQNWTLAEEDRPDYSGDITLRVVLGYQQAHFDQEQQFRFFNQEFTLSDKCDRMGFRLTGPEIKADINGILSEGICFGAIQIPPDGQPIVLLNDRQTIGGYPKIGSVLSLDIPKLTQRLAGTKIRFEAISIDDAHNLLHLAHSRFERTRLLAVS